MRIALASDHAGYLLKQSLARRLLALGHEVYDQGPDSAERCDYPDYAAAAARLVAGGACDRGILLCGTGIGMSMAANKVPGIRAALVHDRFTAVASREHNDANVLCLGARILAQETALSLAQAWLETRFSGGRHSGRLEKLHAIEAAAQPAGL